jgi:hypothetical protein
MIARVKLRAPQEQRSRHHATFWALFPFNMATSVLFLSLVTSAESAVIRELPPPAKRFALLVGVGKYRDRNITSLDGPVHDVEQIKNALISYAGFDSNNVLTLTSETTDSKTTDGKTTDENELPTRDNIIRKLNQLKPKLAGGLLLVAFSGHGIYKFSTPFLLTYETVNHDVFDLTETAASVVWLRKKLQTVNAKQIILLLDACQTDPEAGMGFGDNTMSPEFKAAFEMLVVQPFQASAVLYATRPPERAYINDEKRGFFSAGGSRIRP